MFQVFQLKWAMTGVREIEMGFPLAYLAAAFP
jgi:hypothetical protein